MTWEELGNDYGFPLNTFILVACPSGYLSTSWEFRAAQFDVGTMQWYGADGDRLTESGLKPKYWTRLPILQ